jgi:hypothetical protein
MIPCDGRLERIAARHIMACAAIGLYYMIHPYAMRSLVVLFLRILAKPSSFFC